MALIAAHLNAGHSGGDSVELGIHSPCSPTSIPPPPPPFSPSLISLMVSVDVKHHVYLLTSSIQRRSAKRRCSLCISLPPPTPHPTPLRPPSPHPSPKFRVDERETGTAATASMSDKITSLFWRGPAVRFVHSLGLLPPTVLRLRWCDCVGTLAASPGLQSNVVMRCIGL